MAKFRVIDGDAVTATLIKLEARIKARFQASNLLRVCNELTTIARETQDRATKLNRPNVWIRVGVVTVLLLGLLLGIYGAKKISLADVDAKGGLELSSFESLVNLLVLMGIAIFSLVTFEARVKRGTALTALHELRSIIHVIDMHQLTKDPSMIGQKGTHASPRHDMSAFELIRYLDYCSEMLSLTAKLAALYAQDVKDVGVVDAASDIEQLATNLSQKVWQKISILKAM